jgi:hypothetical protein
MPIGPPPTPPPAAIDLHEVLQKLLRDMYPYQREAFEDAVHALKAGNMKMLCEIGCGGGKSWILLALALWWGVHVGTPSSYWFLRWFCSDNTTQQPGRCLGLTLATSAELDACLL